MTTALFELDLTNDTRLNSEAFAETTQPPSSAHNHEGLHYPLADGFAMCLANDDKLDDCQGSVVVDFSLGAGDNGGEFLSSWAGYLKLSARRHACVGEAQASFYGHRIRLGWHWQENTTYTLSFHWHHQIGVTLVLAVADEDVKVAARNATWQPYRQRYIPVSIGGKLASTRPGRRTWTNTFQGWIRNVRCHRTPLRAPGHAYVPTASADTACPPCLVGTEGLTVLDWHSPVIEGSALAYDVIPDRIDNFRECQSHHPELFATYHGADSAFEGLLAVARYVGDLWPHTEYWPWPREIFDARGDSLLANIKAGETAGMCGGYAHVMEEALWALGIPAKRTQVASHSSLEAYDHTHDKWICLEADNASGQGGCWLDPDGVPYSIGELSALLCQDEHQPGLLAKAVRHHPLGNQIPAGALQQVVPESWLRECYVMMGWYRRTDYGTDEPLPSYWYAIPSMACHPLEPYTDANLQTLLDDWRPLYWSCDRVQVAVESAEEHTLELAVKAVQSQFLSGVDARIDQGEAQVVQEHFTWRLHPGINQISLQTRNELRAKGHPFRATIHVA